MDWPMVHLRVRCHTPVDCSYVDSRDNTIEEAPVGLFRLWLGIPITVPERAVKSCPQSCSWRIDGGICCSASALFGGFCGKTVILYGYG